MAAFVDEFDSERVHFRGINETDAPEIVEWRSDPSVYRFFRAAHRITLDEHLSWYRNNYLTDESRYDWMLIDSAAGLKLGVFGAVRKGNSAEVNYILSPCARHKGYAVEGLSRIIQYVRDKWHTDIIIAEIHRDNAPSIALAERTGFTLESESGDFLLYSSEE